MTIDEIGSDYLIYNWSHRTISERWDLKRAFSVQCWDDLWIYRFAWAWILESRKLGLLQGFFWERSEPRSTRCPRWSCWLGWTWVWCRGLRTCWTLPRGSVRRTLLCWWTNGRCSELDRCPDRWFLKLVYEPSDMKRGRERLSLLGRVRVGRFFRREITCGQVKEIYRWTQINFNLNRNLDQTYEIVT